MCSWIQDAGELYMLIELALGGEGVDTHVGVPAVRSVDRVGVLWGGAFAQALAPLGRGACTAIDLPMRTC